MEIKTLRSQSITKKKEMDAILEWNPNFEKELNQTYGQGGAMQEWIDSAVINGCRPYLPFDQGVLMRSADTATVIGSGTVTWKTPYARYLYYGRVMVDPVTGKAAFFDKEFGFWSRPGVKKVESNRLIQYQGDSKRGAFWFERWKNDNLKSFGNQIAQNFGVDMEVF